MSNYDALPNSVGWHILEGYPWWPVYICDPTKLRPNLHLLGSGHKGALRKARDFPKDYGLVYFFGSHNFTPVRLKKGLTLRPWDCPDKEKFLKGVPNHLVKKKAQLDELLIAIQEAEDYLSMPEDIRLPPHMVPSDLDPSLDPPPPIERMEVDDADEDEDEDAQDDGGSDHGGDDDDENMSDGSDTERRSKKSSKEKPKKKKSSSSSSSKDKKSSSKSSSKDKDKKVSKSKKDKNDTKDSKKNLKKDKDVSDDKKRKTPSGADEPAGDAAAGAAGITKASSSKVAKKDKAADVKSEAGDGVTSATAKTSKSSKSKTEKAAAAGVSAGAAGEALSGDALSAVLEKEIKWILANCQFEEMTTKTVRKLLEKRLQMDLRHHKGAIKEGVARVIASMEDGTDAAMADVGHGDDADAKTEVTDATDAPVIVAAAADAEAEEEAPSREVAAEGAASETPAPATDEPVKSEEPAAVVVVAPVKSIEEPRDSKSEDGDASVAQHLRDAERELGLALNEEPKLMAALQALQKQVLTVDRAELTKSALLPTLVALRAHEEASVSNLVAAIASQWAADDLVPAPKPIREEDILAMKDTLENAETSHDDVLACLQKLAKMRLQMSHLKNTGIARVVAGLRQHANDKVSIAAINLRKSWIQLTKSTADSKSDADRVKTLESLNRILEQSDSAEGEHSHLAVLEKLQGMTLSTQDIIKSKIGVVVSKLRKSSNEKVAKAAAQLRKKWKTEAAA